MVPRFRCAAMLAAICLVGCSAPPVAPGNTKEERRQVPNMTEAELARVGVPKMDESLICDKYPTKRAYPDYPSSALKREQEGWVLLGYALDGSGHAIDIVVVRSSPKTVFDRSAIEALEQMEFRLNIIKPNCQILYSFFLR
jgi:TonB family protein